MVNFNCFFCIVGRKKKDKGDKGSSHTINHNKVHKTLQVKFEEPVKPSDIDEVKSSFTLPVPFVIKGGSRCNIKVMTHESPVGGEVEEVAYEGEDEHDESSSMKRDYSDCDLQAHVSNDQSVEKEMNTYNSLNSEINDQLEKKDGDGGVESIDMIQSGHVSDPGIGRAEFWASPKLKRSCSNLDTRDLLKRVVDKLPSSKSFEDMQRLSERVGEEILPHNHGSPFSERSHYSADKVMLKKHSSSQILPSRSRKLWWKLFLWSHRNLHGPPPAELALNQQGGYSSDTLETKRDVGSGGIESPGSFTQESFNICKNDKGRWDGFGGGSGLWPQNQWVAFSAESSSLNRVDEWVKDLTIQPSLLDENEKDDYDPGTVSSPSRCMSHLGHQYPPNMNLPDEILHANSVIQSLNSSSTVAHISGTGLKVIPVISRFSSLRSVNLWSNYIVHITPGSLPKGLHSLNLSRNKISTIEGLRELTRLRVLDLSYNRISRIGQGLSNCTLIKELYLAGNKISDVEGMHRLMKLTILDLSFNKITTTKALGQLVANYNSLLALNLLGNPVLSNISDDQLRKTIRGLLPKLAYLNKQPINPQKAREVATEAIARVALGNNGWSDRRRGLRRVDQSGPSSPSRHRSNASISPKSQHRLRTRAHHHSPLKTKSSALDSPNR